VAAVVTRTGLILGERYRLDKRIAAGGVGQVWRATDLLLSRPVAVKVLRPEYAEHPETLDRFRKEARNAGALSHPHVAQVFDYGPAGPDWPPYLVMEFVDGPSLADILAIDPVEAAFALDVIAQSADGLSAAHRAGLVHRDVKPGNLLIGPEGQVKITDFGIAYAAGQAPVTGPNLVMGTTQYMAPERISGGPGTPASDLYALGIVLHECLTGVPPYEGTPSDVMAAHLYLPLPPLPANVPPELDDLVARLTAKDPAGRISDARELAALAAGLRDSIAGGQLVPSARAATLSGPGPAATGRPGAAGTPVGLTAAVAAEPGEAAGQFGAGWPGDDQPPAGTTGPGVAGGGPGEPTDEWAVPARMSVPATPVGPGSGDPERRRLRAGALAVIAALVAAAVLVVLLVSGALRGAPAGHPTPGGSSSTGAATPGGRVSPGASPVSGSVGGNTAPAGPAGTSTQSGGGKTAAPTPSAHSSSTAPGSPSPTPRGSSSGPPSSSSSPTPSGSPSSSSSPTPSGSPSPTPSASTTPPVTCVLGVCL
jgi:eukaryotic-like serine/threonine-protein kinase